MKKLRFRMHNPLPIHRLPFVRMKKDRACFWDVPREGEYFGGCRTGKALALIYLKFLRENSRDMASLQHIVLDMLGLSYSLDASSKNHSLRGQVVGFFSELDKLLSAGAKEMGECLDKQDNLKLLEDANRGLKSKDTKVLAEAKKRDKLQQKATEKTC